MAGFDEQQKKELREIVKSSVDSSLDEFFTDRIQPEFTKLKNRVRSVEDRFVVARN